jgi:hypothetical protein
LLRYRAAAVRSDLLQIAVLIEHGDDPDPASVQAVRALLHEPASPLYDASVDMADLHLTLEQLRNALGQRQPITRPRPRDHS